VIIERGRGLGDGAGGIFQIRIRPAVLSERQARPRNGGGGKQGPLMKGTRFHGRRSIPRLASIRLSIQLNREGKGAQKAGLAGDRPARRGGVPVWKLDHGGNYGKIVSFSGGKGGNSFEHTSMIPPQRPRNRQALLQQKNRHVFSTERRGA